MMVTFVSQCQKNALKKTRRVLDSFANRIGNNTWQTIITQEGLNAVQKLLRKTASKSTAVSCHWIRSRSRSDFLWVVGNKNQFDENGTVPVNYGITKRFIGEKEIMLDEIYANTNGQRLDQHLFAVGYLAKALIEKIIPGDKNLAESAYVAGCWHDIGKIDENFQNWIIKELKKQKKYKDIPDEGVHIEKGTFSWEKYPRHNELSLLLFEILFKLKEKKDSQFLNRVKHAIYWHHAKPFRKNELVKLVDIYNKIDNFEEKYRDIISLVQTFLSSITDISENYSNSGEINLYENMNFLQIDSLLDFLDYKELPSYKKYIEQNNLEKYQREISINAKNNLIRTAILTADRLISNLTAAELDIYISNRNLENLLDGPLNKERGLTTQIKECLDGFQKNYPSCERNKKQEDTATELADEEITIGVLNGPAGCGKTKIALEWALNTSAKKIYWICPRVQVCEGIFSDLCSDEYLPNTNIEIVTGEIKRSLRDGRINETIDGKEFSSDIIITTIDQIVNSITTHKHITTLIDFMNAHVVFDEYHEYITMQGFNLLFAELIEAKKYQQTDESLPNTLLVSATPNPLFIDEFLGLKNDIVSMQSFNNSNYKIKFVDYDEKEDSINPLILEQKEKSIFVISNTAIIAQQSFIEHQDKENSILFHSKFIKKDKEYLFNEVFNSFKKNGSEKYDVLRSGPVVQASLNITCKKMISEMTHAENFLQRLGRLGRFGENNEVNQYIIAITNGVKSGKSKDGSSRFLNELDSLQSAKVWYEFLENHLTKESYKINEIYNLYEIFYKDENVKKYIRQDLVSALKKSVGVIDANILDPKSFPSKLKNEKGGIKIKKNSLRGNSLFVQMAKCQINSATNYSILNEYAYNDVNDAITMGNKVIEGYGDSKRNLLSFMAKKHHNIRDVKKSYKDAQLVNEARDPITPIYLSYIPEDLKKVESEAHEFAQYYGVGLNQAIGVISLQQLKKKTD